MNQPQTPTEREMDLMKVLWRRGQATVRQVYEDLRDEIPIVQNTVQALLRNMEEKGLVEHWQQGRAFVYRPKLAREKTTRHMVGNLLETVFDGAIDQMVDSLFSLRRPNQEELRRLEHLIASHKSNDSSKNNQ